MHVCVCVCLNCVCVAGFQERIFDCQLCVPLLVLARRFFVVLSYSQRSPGSCLSRMVGSRVYVGGLPYGVRERDLERFFKGYGRTRDILIKNGYGFVVSTR